MATSWSSCPASGRSPTPPRCCAGIWPPGAASTEVLPLYGRLSAADQHKVFSAHTGRRIVLATNVAETSLTVPGIRYVIDPGHGADLPVLAAQQGAATADRTDLAGLRRAAGRALRPGRRRHLHPAVLARTTSPARPAFTDPEIARTSLASVILQMASLDLGDIAVFPFLDPPDRRQITDGITVLTELGALDTGPMATGRG